MSEAISCIKKHIGSSIIAYLVVFVTNVTPTANGDRFDLNKVEHGLVLTLRSVVLTIGKVVGTLVGWNSNFSHLHLSHQVQQEQQ